MKIEMNTIYHLPTRELEDDFLKQAEKQELLWNGRNPTKTKLWSNCKEEYCIVVRAGQLDGWCDKAWFEATSSLPIIEWKIGFTKADMQVGQLYKTRNGRICTWSMEDKNTYYSKTPQWGGSGSGADIIEVYPFPLTPIWKREEPKYKVKTELTKEQAEKLGLEFCEEVME